MYATKYKSNDTSDMKMLLNIGVKKQKELLTANDEQILRRKIKEAAAMVRRKLYCSAYKKYFVS